jgi:lipoprotein Spr
MLKLLRIFFIAVLMLCFLVSCRSRKREAKPVLKTAEKHQVNKAKKMPAAAHSGRQENALRDKLGLSSGDIRRSRLYSFVADWYGTPYRLGGCKKSGVDCSCFAGVLSEQVYGVMLPRRSEDIFRSCDHFSIRDARAGDLVFFKIGGKDVNHVGVYLRDKWFVHASTSRGVMINNLEEAYYDKYFFCAGRLKDA